MTTIKIKDGAEIFYKDWSAKNGSGQPIVFHHGWPLSADDWDTQKLFFLNLDKLARKFLAARGDKRRVVADIHARYFGAELDDRSLTPGEQPRSGPTAFDEWLNSRISAPA